MSSISLAVRLDSSAGWKQSKAGLLGQGNRNETLGKLELITSEDGVIQTNLEICRGVSLSLWLDSKLHGAPGAGQTAIGGRTITRELVKVLRFIMS